MITIQCKINTEMLAQSSKMIYNLLGAITVNTAKNSIGTFHGDRLQARRRMSARDATAMNIQTSASLILEFLL